MAAYQLYTLAPDEEDVKVFTNHPTLYFDDGNLILSCGNTLFRVHRSIIAKHSPVIRQTLDNTQLHTLRGCQHLPLGDNPVDIEALLSVLYDGLRVNFPMITTSTFPLLSRLLHASTRYKVETIRADLLACIQNEWPSLLHLHDMKMQAIWTNEFPKPSAALHGGQADHDPNPPVLAVQHQDAPVNPALVIRLLRETKAGPDHLLFPLFYAMSLETVQSGPLVRGARIAPLDNSDVERLIAGIEELRSRHSLMAVQCPQVLNPPHDATCLAGIRKCWCVIAPDLLLAPEMARRPIEAWRNFIAHFSTPACQAGFSFCYTCATMLVEVLEHSRSTLWNDLATFFELC
ncbi:hypothetical protein CERSUDRAFT_123789 [Gelatoporia subvermispora B]|uniref:BTB domain-containing protein n=1 Tax=Ceriporiopsis subvermispora (strain B) TaxID=914234 RepID=M2RD11_CERS8|nr:hypothetical protein CERSUDRAFT_123789 [Gelatoporia subvermispora B]